MRGENTTAAETCSGGDVAVTQMNGGMAAMRMDVMVMKLRGLRKPAIHFTFYCQETLDYKTCVARPDFRSSER